MAVLIGDVRERVVRIGEPHSLCGILAEPAERDIEDRPAFLFLNAGILHRVGPSRTSVTLSRRLAAAGFPALRFDFSGIGDSAHRPDAESFDVRGVEETREAMDHLTSLIGTRRFVTVGLCSGADVGYAVALADPRVVGMVSLDGHSYRTWRYWIHRYGPRLWRAESWMNVLTGRTYVGAAIRRLLRRASSNGSDPVQEVEVFRRRFPPRPEVAAGYQALADRGVDMLQIFTGGIERNYNYREQFQDAFRSVDFGGRLRLEFFAEADHTFTAYRDRSALLDLVGGWADDRYAPSRTASVAFG